MRSTIIAGNWKLNPPREDGQALFSAVRDAIAARRLPMHVQVAVFPPYPYLGAFQGNAGGLCVGAQDLAVESWGAYTGAVHGELLAQFACKAVLIGHSERRHHFGDSDELCGRKLKAAAEAGLTPYLCVGEQESERDADQTFEVIDRQLRTGLADLPATADLVIAYEPVWAIGTGRTATPAMAAEAHAYTRRQLAEILGDAERAARTPILYGGSVKPENASELLAEADIDGALIGGASLKAESFLAILDAAM